MVHLATVPNDKDVNTPLVKGLETLKVDESPDQFTSSVYGSRFAAQDLPKYEMPDHEMPKEVAYRMIRSAFTFQVFQTSY